MSDWGATERVSAEVQLADGQSLRGEVYVQMRVAHRAGPETLLELLNRPEPFFALTADDGVTFVSKAQVAIVSSEATSPLDDPARLGAAKRIGLAVTVAGGEEYTGWAAIELPPTRARTLDFLNGPDRFFQIGTDDATRYVHRAHVRLVRPLD
ncbi:MAG TPA: hypothetical protein VFS40_13430 [Gemmatimonadales bacterium]|nr:hypothetical protein [Gemmatimonadales bacterium]